MKKKHGVVSLPRILFFLLGVTLLFSPYLVSQEEESDIKKDTQEMFDMPLDELLNVKVITASKTEERIIDIPASVVLITREDIENHGYLSLSEILENIPGLYGIEDYTNTDMNFGVRGFWSGSANRNMIILVNGVPQLRDLHSNYPLAMIPIPVEAIERIEVIRGPMSVIYGHGAFYGAINIITDSAKSQIKPISIASGSAGSDGKIRLFLRAAGLKDDFKYVVNAAIAKDDGPDMPLADMMSNPQLLTGYGFNIDDTTKGTLESSQKYFNFVGNFSDFYLNITYAKNDKEVYFVFPSFGNGSIDNISASNVTLGYSKDISQNFSLNTRITYFQSREWLKYKYFSDNFYGFEEQESHAALIELDTLAKLSENIDIKSGLYYRIVFSAYDMYDLPSYKTPTVENSFIHLADGDNIITRALFTQVNWQLLKKLKLVAGVRLEQTPAYSISAELSNETDLFKKVTNKYFLDKLELIPRFAVIYNLTDNHIFKLLYGKAINRPSFFQNYQNSVAQGKKETLRPEIIQTLEFNYIASFQSDLTLNVSLFYNTLKNLITRVVKFDNLGNYVSYSDNAGEMTTYGAELTIKADPLKNIRVEISGSYQKTDDKRTGYQNITVAYSPSFLSYVKMSYRTKNLVIGVTGNYVSSMEPLWDETIINSNGVRGGRIGLKVDGYFNAGLNIRIQDIILENFYINLKCSNVFGAKIRYPVYTNNQWADRGMLGYGRQYLLTLGYKF